MHHSSSPTNTRKTLSREIGYLPLIILALAMTNCSSLERTGRTAALAGGGALAGHELSDGSPLFTAVGAVAGAGVGDYWQQRSENREEDSYIDGFLRGQAHALKEAYWAEKDEPSAPTEGAPMLERRYYEVPIPEHVREDGVIIEAHSQIIDVVE